MGYCLKTDLILRDIIEPAEIKFWYAACCKILQVGLEPATPRLEVWCAVHATGGDY